jgi:hypothetical protein
MNQYVAFSGGKDSTALVLRLAEKGEKFECLFTPTGNELPDLLEHMKRVLELAGNPTLHLPDGPSLQGLIEEFQALPNWRQRWCTRMIKIEPCIAFLKKRPGSTLLVGLRADEESRVGIYGEWATYRYPLREWGWGFQKVLNYCDERGIKIPPRTDCAVCYGQQIGEWFRLWRDWPDWYKKGEEWESLTGHTFRSKQRDSWPAALKDMRIEFEKGRRPKKMSREETCRVCSL